MTVTEDTMWRRRRGLLPDGDPLVRALEELAERGRDHRFRAVGLVDPATGRPGPPQDLTVTGGTVTARTPTPPTADGREAPYTSYALPGFVDSHAHVSSASDLVGLLVHGVTGFRQLWGEPAHLYAAGVHRARHAVLPRPWVTAGVVDGPRSRIPQGVTVVDGVRAVRQVIEDALAFGFDGIKVYDDVERPVFDVLVREAERAGLPVVGHIPEAVPLVAAQRTMRSSEHLYGLVPNVFRLPPERRWDALARALADRTAEPGGAPGHFVCPTLVCWRARSGERRYTRPSRAALQAVDEGRRRSWQAAARDALRLDPAEAHRRGGLVDALGGIARTLAETGTRLLVGSDCGNPFVLAGPSFHKELAELSRAGLDFTTLLRAATTHAYEAMGRAGSPAAGSLTAGSPAPGAPADLVFYRRPPDDAELSALARPDAVLVDGVLLDGDDLDRLWALRLAASGLGASGWARGELDPPVTTGRPTKEAAHAG
ncbi:amidohydrolase [Streptomyces ipomoeae]|uniref:amidohydrolase family protein n=1 Tax=Streptomyces ipomoeae TaxID=103232 RepID=UPI0029B02BAB|nr:amidohydrolase [Streptomyces ipomoeae]MDX2825934.1 amidohydrolase [Streptomyces ipomoeae]MDX2878497.1 amidohydrolase [Streptomyces ipomoeae]